MVPLVPVVPLVPLVPVVPLLPMVLVVPLVPLVPVVSLVPIVYPCSWLPSCGLSAFPLLDFLMSLIYLMQSVHSILNGTSAVLRPAWQAKKIAQPGQRGSRADIMRINSSADLFLWAT